VCVCALKCQCVPVDGDSAGIEGRGEKEQIVWKTERGRMTFLVINGKE